MFISNDYRVPNAATVNKSAQSAAYDAGGTFTDIVNRKAAEAETKPVQEGVKKERAIYELFLEKLQKLQ